MEPGAGDSKPLASFEVDGCDMVALVESGRYAEIANLLSRHGDGVALGDGKAPQCLVQALCRICEACTQCREEAERLRRADGEVQQRERDLGRELLGLLALLADNTQSLEPVSAPPPRAPRGVLQRLSSALGMTDLGTPPVGGAGTPGTASPPPEFTICCLGPFQFYRGAQDLNSWSNGKGKSLFKYLLAHRVYPTPKEVLMDVFWLDAPPQSARNSLNAAVYSLRHNLVDAGVSCPLVLYEDDCYLINAELTLWLDSEAFAEQVAAAQACEQRGDPAGAVCAYRAAESLYQGEFHADERYEDWVAPQREALRVDYQRLLDYLCQHYFEGADYDACIAVARKGLDVDDCDEGLHRQLMCSYSRQGLHHLAHRQYHLCVSALERELDIDPCGETVELFERIRGQQEV